MRVKEAALALPASISSFERIIGPVEVAQVLTLQYTAPDLRRISDIYLTSGSSARTVELYVVPVGQSATSSNKLLAGYSTLASDLRVITGLNYAIRKGETIWTNCSGAGVNLVVIAYR